MPDLFTVTESAPSLMYLHIGDGLKPLVAEYEVDGGTEGGTLVIDVQELPDDWSIDQAVSAFELAIKGDSLRLVAGQFRNTLSGLPARVRKALQAGDMVVEAA